MNQVVGSADLLIEGGKGKGGAEGGREAGLGMRHELRVERVES
jgi:hypothetical protein